MGLSFLAYPIIANLYYKLNQTRVINNYNIEMQNMPDEDKEKLKEEFKEYNKKISENSHSEVDILSNLKILGYIEIPKINVKVTVRESTSNDVLSLGVRTFRKHIISNRKRNTLSFSRTFWSITV